LGQPKDSLCLWAVTRTSRDRMGHLNGAQHLPRLYQPLP